MEKCEGVTEIVKSFFSLPRRCLSRLIVPNISTVVKPRANKTIPWKIKEKNAL
jgi:hypothetical protein